MVKFNEEKQNQKLEELKKGEAESLTKILSQKYGLPYVNLNLNPINIEALRYVKQDEAESAKIAPFNLIGKKIQVGILSPTNPKTLEAVENLEKKGLEPELFMTSEAGLDRVWERYQDLSSSVTSSGGALDVSSEEISNFLNKTSNLESIKQLIKENLESKESYRISKILEIMLSGALALKASDVHLEPEESYIRLRYRLDGVLTDVLNFDNVTYDLLLSRLKLLSNLKLNISGQAQDGRFSIKLREKDIEIRTSILPGAYNDAVVMRILNPEAIGVPLEELGIHPKLLKVLLYEISKPNGMILTTGPTGSGKTTTLYAFLKKIHSPGIKIITIENPIEYHLPGIVQTQTDDRAKQSLSKSLRSAFQGGGDQGEGYTFSEGLRSALRQDPDIIMVGEIRDKETAEIAINASLTGHLVFSTLHTNNAAGAFPRLIDLGVNPKVITSALNVVMAQRLVRRLCVDCKKKIALEGENKKIIEKILETIKDPEYLEGLDTDSIWEPVGCEKCNHTGFKGRVGIYEAVRSTEKIEEVVEKNPSEREIEEASKEQNILNMGQDGVIKALSGLTSLDELGRVVNLFEKF